MTLPHERTLELLSQEMQFQGLRRWFLRSPAPGWYRPKIAWGAWCAPHTVVGTLDVLGRRHFLVTPAGLSGWLGHASDVDAPAGDVHAVACGGPIAILETEPNMLIAGAPIAGAAVGPAAAAASSTVDGLVFRAPTSGRFYGRASPDKPAFVAEGATLTTGTTVCLLEVMKTFHRVTYGGPGLPDTARVRRVLVADGADVNAGEPLLALE
jgi:acetyl-CoA carboxylase biotin carboxyl carrier protein